MAYIVTDLTLMSGGNACLACLEEEQLFCVRPLFNPNAYNQIAWYEQKGIRQGTKLDLALLKRQSSIPHSEDATCTAVNILGHLNDNAMQELLDGSSHSAIVEGFGVAPLAGEKHFHHDGELPAQSIITLKILPRNININQDSYNPGRIKATITDGDSFALKWLPVTDLRYINVSDDAFAALRNSIKRANCVYLRIGLTRCYPVKEHNGYWLQINGLYIY